MQNTPKRILTKLAEGVRYVNLLMQVHMSFKVMKDSTTQMETISAGLGTCFSTQRASVLR